MESDFKKFNIGQDIQQQAETCEQHGDYISRNIFHSVWTKCPQCASEKAAIKKQEDEERQSIARMQAWQKKLGESCIPDRFQDRTFNNYEVKNDGQKNALMFARAYAVMFNEELSTGRGAIFCGKPGTGKTHLAVAIALHIMLCNKPALFTTVQRAVRRIKDAWRKGATESESDVIALYVHPDLLILDEIGVQFGSDFERNFLFDILNERYENKKPTLLLSNLDIEEIKEFLGARIFDRLKEDGAQCIVFDWESKRGSI